MSETLLAVFIGIGAGVFGAWGALWYRMGKVAAEVRYHNKMLSEVKDALEAIKDKMEGE